MGVGVTAVVVVGSAVVVVTVVVSVLVTAPNCTICYITKKNPVKQTSLWNRKLMIHTLD